MRATAFSSSCAILCAVLVAPSSALAQQSDAWQTCENYEASPEQIIASCTTIIQSATSAPLQIAGAYYHRGEAHYKRGELTANIADLAEAVNRDLGNSDTLGNLYYLTRDYNRALAAFNRYLQEKSDFGGLGLRIQIDKGNLVVTGLVDGGASAGAWVMVNDIITDIDGQPTRSLSLQEATTALRGAPESTATLTISRKGAAKPIVLKIARKLVPVDKVENGYTRALIDRGKVYFALGDYDRVISDLAEAIALTRDSKDPFARDLSADASFWRASALLAKGDYDMAIAEFAPDNQTSGNIVGAYLGRGNSYYAKGDYDKAVKDYNQVITLNDKNALAYYQRSKAYAAKSDVPDSNADKDTAARLAPSLAIAVGHLPRDPARYTDTILLFSDALKVNDHDPVMLEGLAEAYGSECIYQHDHGAREYENCYPALADYAAVIALGPPNSRAYAGRGAIDFVERRYDEAIADLSISIQLDQSNSGAHFLRGQAYEAQRNYDHAISDYSETIQLDPKNTEALADRGNAYQLAGRLDQAIADYTAAIRLAPKYGDAFTNRGITYFKKKEYDKAIDDLTQAISLTNFISDMGLQRVEDFVSRGMDFGGGVVTLFNMRGNSYFARGDYYRAVVDYTDAIKLSVVPGPVIRENRAVTYLKLNDRPNAAADYEAACRAATDLKQALSDCNHAIQLAPNSSTAFDARGLLHLKNEQLDEAIADYNRAIKANPKLAAALYGRGLARRKKGQQAPGDRDIQTAVAFDPNISKKLDIK